MKNRIQMKFYTLFRHMRVFVSESERAFLGQSGDRN